MSSPTPHRIDPPSTASPTGGPHVYSRPRGVHSGRLVDGASAGSPQARVESVASPSGSPPDDLSPEQSPPSESPEQWLQMHATELVDRLQSWASELDAREAQLNARSSLQDHRERQFRLRQQDLMTELAEQQRRIDRLRGEMEAQARRLAFGGGN